MTIECRGNDANEKVQLVLEFLFNECTAGLLTSKNNVCQYKFLYLCFLFL